MRVAYLLNRPQKERLEAIAAKRESDDHVYGMLRLRPLGVDTQCVELEDVFSSSLSHFLRERILNVYWVHAPLFFRLLRYDIVFASTAFGTQLLHALWPGKKPRWVMLDFNVNGFIGSGSTLKQRIFSWLVSRSDGIVTIDAEEQTKLKQRFKKPEGAIVFIPFGIDTDYFAPISAAEEKIIFSPGRDTGRDYKTFFRATKNLGYKVITTTRPWTIKKYLPLPTHVINKDLSNEELLRQYAIAKIIVIPLGHIEGTNNAMGCSTLLEAMSMGKAVVVTRTPMSESYVVDGENALLVPPHDSMALETTIKRVLEDDQLRKNLGAHARESVRMRYAADRFASDLRDFFEQVLSRR